MCDTMTNYVALCFVIILNKVIGYLYKIWVYEISCIHFLTSIFFLIDSFQISIQKDCKIFSDFAAKLDISCIL